MSSLQKPFQHLIEPKIQRFFSNRAPRADVAKLSLKNVYIFFSREGLLFALLLVITFIAGVNYANNLVLGLCFYLSSIWVISLHLTFSHLSGIEVRLLDVSMTSVDKPILVTLQLISHSSRPRRQIHVRFDTQASDSHELTKEVTLTQLTDSTTICVSVPATHRGRFELPRLILSTVYPLGIMRTWSYVYFSRPAWVYPKPLAFDWQKHQTIQGDDERETSLYTIKGQNDFDMLDTYAEGEPLSRVSWAHVARGQGMLTKHFADTVGREQVLDYRYMPAAHHEQKLSQLCYAIQQLHQAGLPFQLNLPNQIGVVGQGDAFVEASLLRLAKAP